MRHIREKDSEQQTVLMVQVENEVGYLGRGRDRSSEADHLFRAPVPEVLLRETGLFLVAYAALFYLAQGPRVRELAGLLRSRKAV